MAVSESNWIRNEVTTLSEAVMIVTSLAAEGSDGVPYRVDESATKGATGVPYLTTASEDSAAGKNKLRRKQELQSEVSIKHALQLRLSKWEFSGHRQRCHEYYVRSRTGRYTPWYCPGGDCPCLQYQPDQAAAWVKEVTDTLPRAVDEAAAEVCRLEAQASDDEENAEIVRQRPPQGGEGETAAATAEADRCNDGGVRQRAREADRPWAKCQAMTAEGGSCTLGDRMGPGGVGLEVDGLPPCAMTAGNSTAAEDPTTGQLVGETEIAAQDEVLVLDPEGASVNVE